MRKLLILLTLCLSASLSLAQSANINGILYAAEFGQWTMPTGQNGSYAWSGQNVCVVNSGGLSFQAFTVGTPVTIVDANPSHTETVTPSVVNTSGTGCTVQFSPAPLYAHFSYSIKSGTAGLQEAINWGLRQPSFNGLVQLTPEWSQQGGTTGMITAAKGSSTVSIFDFRTAQMAAYTWNGSAYVQVAVDPNVASLAGDNNFTGQDWFKYLNGKCQVDRQSGATFGTKLFTNAQADALCTTQIYDSLNVIGSQTPGGNLTWSKSNSVIPLGNMTFALGSNTIAQPSGTNSVAWLGQGGGWASTGAGGAAAGSYLTYSGSGTAISIGDSSATSYFSRMEDLGLILPATSSATGIKLTQGLFSSLKRLRLGAALPNTATCLNYDGTGSYTAFNYLESPYFSNCLIGIKQSGPANGNQALTVINGSLAGPGSGVSGSIGWDLQTGDSNNAMGLNIEGWEKGIKIQSSYNVFPMLRFEGNTTDIDFGTTGQNNLIFTDDPDPVVTGTNVALNTVWPIRHYHIQSTGDALFRWDGAGAWTFRASSICHNVQAVDTTNKWQWCLKDNVDTAYIKDLSTNNVRLSLGLGGESRINGDGTAGVNFNVTSGTGGTGFYDGATHVTAQFNSVGNLFFKMTSSGTHYGAFDGTFTAARTFTFPDTTGTVALLGLAQSWGAKQTFALGADAGGTGITNAGPISGAQAVGMNGALTGVTTLSMNNQFSNTLASGTAPMVITSTTPVANLTTVPVTYNSAGSQITGVHIVIGSCTLGTSCSITLSGAAVFTSGSSYQCSATDETAAAAIQFAPSSGSSFAFTGTGTDLLSWQCIGK